MRKWFIQLSVSTLLWAIVLVLLSFAYLWLFCLNVDDPCACACLHEPIIPGTFCDCRLAFSSPRLLNYVEGSYGALLMLASLSLGCISAILQAVTRHFNFKRTVLSSFLLGSGLGIYVLRIAISAWLGHSDSNIYP